MFSRKSANPAAVAETRVAPARMTPDDPPVELEALWTPPAATAPVPDTTIGSRSRTRKTVEQLLLERGQIAEEQLAQARNVQSQTPGKSLTQILLTMNAATEAQILAALAETLGLGFEQPERSQVDPQRLLAASNRITSGSATSCPFVLRTMRWSSPSPIPTTSSCLTK